MGHNEVKCRPTGLSWILGQNFPKRDVQSNVLIGCYYKRVKVEV